MTLPVAERWFAKHDVQDGITCVTEPHAHPLVRANIWRVVDDRVLWIDAGLGVAPLHEAFSDINCRDDILFVTHSHLDHAGGASEFDEVLAHEQNTHELGDDNSKGLVARDFCAALGLSTTPFGAQLPDLLIEAIPSGQFEPTEYKPRPYVATRIVKDGDIIETGKHRFTVFKLPGHTPDSVGLYDANSGALFCGDCLYDGQLLDSLHASDRLAYRESMQRLLSLDLETVYPGHGPPLSANRAREIASRYLEDNAEVKGIRT